jgi:8-amino-7-oxononanoate synthase
MYQTYQQHLATLNDTGKYRRLPEPFDVKNYLDFSTNDYLKLSCNQHVIQAAIDAAKIYGVGSGGSRLLSGNSMMLEDFEAQIAKDKNAAAALVFNSGFQANVSVLAALLDAKIWRTRPLVFLDKLCHNSLYQGIFLSGAEFQRYAHNDINHLARLLAKFSDDPRPKFIVTETVFGMDGDVLPIEKVANLAVEYRAFLYLDEAHATGILGTNGYGLSTSLDLVDIPSIVMGTFSKAIGCSGGYVTCNQILKEYLINKAHGFIYSTAPSPMYIGAASKAWAMLKDFSEQRESLLDLSRVLRLKLRALGMNVVSGDSHIVPILVGNEKRAIRLQGELLKKQIMVSCVRPPSVPPGTSRLRVAINASHNQDDINRLVEELKIVIHYIN